MHGINIFRVRDGQDRRALGPARRPRPLAPARRRRGLTVRRPRTVVPVTRERAGRRVRGLAKRLAGGPRARRLPGRGPAAAADADDGRRSVLRHRRSGDDAVHLAVAEEPLGRGHAAVPRERVRARRRQQVRRAGLRGDPVGSLDQATRRRPIDERALPRGARAAGLGDELRAALVAGGRAGACCASTAEMPRSGSVPVSSRCFARLLLTLAKGCGALLLVVGSYVEARDSGTGDHRPRRRHGHHLDQRRSGAVDGQAAAVHAGPEMGDEALALTRRFVDIAAKPLRRLGGLGRHRAVPARGPALPDRPPDLHDGAAEVRPHAGLPRLPRRGDAAADREVPAEEGLVLLGLREPVGQLRVEPRPGPQAEHHADRLLRALARRVPDRHRRLPPPGGRLDRVQSGTRSAATRTATTRSAPR